MTKKDVSYSSVHEFRDAYKAAGFDCPDGDGSLTELDGDAGVALGCTDNSTLYYFTSPQVRDAWTNAVTPPGIFPHDRHLLRYDRWQLLLYPDDRLGAVQEKLGGEIITIPGKNSDAGTEPETPEATAATEPEADGQLGALESLRSSYEESGVDCPRDAFDPSEMQDANALIGACTDGSAVVLFEDEAEGEAWMDNNYESDPKPFKRGYVDGGKWFIMAPDDPDAIIAFMGGELKIVEPVGQ